MFVLRVEHELFGETAPRKRRDWLDPVAVSRFSKLTGRNLGETNALSGARRRSQDRVLVRRRFVSTEFKSTRKF